MRRVLCCECERLRDRYRAAVRLVGGLELWVCRQCWVRWDYGTYLTTRAVGG